MAKTPPTTLTIINVSEEAKASGRVRTEATAVWGALNGGCNLPGCGCSEKPFLSFRVEGKTYVFNFSPAWADAIKSGKPFDFTEIEVKEETI